MLKKVLQLLSPGKNRSDEQSKAANCPICGGTEFKDYNNRPDVCCAQCRSLERSRLLWLVLDKIGVLDRPNVSIFHAAPEKCLLEQFATRWPDSYFACDIAPERYKNNLCRIHQIDLCKDLASIESNQYDIVIHNHVLEHLPCSVEMVLKELNRVLAPGGTHLFSVPFRGQSTDEDLSPNLTPSERTARFAQSDHMRIFGTVDFPQFLQVNFGGAVKRLEVEQYFSEAQLVESNIPAETFRNTNGHSIFIYSKPRD